MQDGRSFKTAERMLATAATQLRRGVFSWIEIIKEFEHYKKNTGGTIAAKTWNQEYLVPLLMAKELLETNNDFSGAEEVVSKVATRWAPESRHRAKVVGSLTQFFEWAVKHQKVSERWKPVYERKILIGRAPSGIGPETRKGDPISDEDVIEIIRDCNPKTHENWMIGAIKLMAVFGLRPIELAHLSIKVDAVTREKFVWCSYQKKSGGGTTKPRRLYVLLPEGLSDEDWIQCVKDHNAFFNRKGQQPLDRVQIRRITLRPWWERHKERLAQESINLVGYSFRHSYSLRGHHRGIFAGAMAWAMGHSLQTHLNSYPWATAQSCKEAFDNAAKG